MGSRIGGYMSTKRAIMSSNVKNGTQEEYPKDSFDRFGDDLCGLVLSYLSLKDSFRYECLSKQWMRTVFTRRHTLSATDVVAIKRRLRDYEEFINNRCEDLMSVFKKWPNITSIDIYIDSEDMEEMFEILLNSYKHSLKEIHIRFDYRIDVQIMDRILAKYGSLFTIIAVPKAGYEIFKSHTKFYTKLRQLSGYSGDNLLSAIVTENNEILVKNLTKFHLFYSDSDWQRLKAFVDYYKNSLKCLSFAFINKKSAEEYIRVLKLLSQMKALRELKIQITFLYNSDAIQSIVDYHCKEFVNKWPQLKRYLLKVRCETDLQVRQLYESINSMKSLQRLDLRLITTEKSKEKSIELTPKSLYPLKRLTQLSLVLENSVLNARFFDSIHTYLPHIQTLNIETILKRSASIEESVNKLPKLKSFSLISHFEEYSAE